MTLTAEHLAIASDSIRERVDLAIANGHGITASHPWVQALTAITTAKYAAEAAER